MSDFSSKLNIIAKNIDTYLKNFLTQQNRNSDLIEPMKYGIFSGGKRFRSAILINTGKIFGVDYKKLIIIGAAIECIHSYSLIHDDLPSMDNDDIRRNKPSMHKKFNEFTAILAGNSLLTLAFEILSGKDLKLPQNTKVELIRTLANCSGHSGLAGGQYSDLTFDNKKISKNTVINMLKKKTGKLFGFCCESVGIIKGKNLKEKDSLRKIGLQIGLLYQITDDLIDYRDDYIMFGKSNKGDKEKGKVTIVSLLGEDKSLNFAQKIKKKLDQKIKKYGNKTNDLLESVEFMLKRKF